MKLSAHKLPWLAVLAFCCIYLPFADSRMLAFHNDEAVYLAQIMRMLEQGTWFQQFQFGETYFHKGPAHYILTLLGQSMFGLTRFAACYMNMALLGLGIFLLAKLVVEAAPQRRDHWLPVSMVLFNITCFGFSFISQMEIELLACYIFAVFCLHRATLSPANRDSSTQTDPLGPLVGFWLVAGVAGLFKSPLHSVLLGFTGLLFWLLDGTLWHRLQQPRFYGATLCGVTFCVLGYLPAYLSAPEAWWQSYVVAQTLERNGFRSSGPTNFFLMTFLLNLAPWLGHALWGWFTGARLLFGKLLGGGQPIEPAAAHLLRLGIAQVVPTILFFGAFGHFATWYGIPVISGLVLAWYGLHVQQDAPLNPKLFWSWTIITLLMAAIIGVIALTPLSADPRWSWLPMFAVGAFVLAGVQAGTLWFRQRQKLSSQQFAQGWWALCCLAILGFGMLSQRIAETELTDIRGILQQHPNAHLSKSNLGRYNFSRFGGLSFTLSHPIHEILTADDAIRAFQRGDLVIARSEEERDRVLHAIAPTLAPEEISQQTWRRLPRNSQAFQKLLQQKGYQAFFHSEAMELAERNFYVLQKANGERQKG